MKQKKSQNMSQGRLTQATDLNNPCHYSIVLYIIGIIDEDKNRETEPYIKKQKI